MRTTVARPAIWVFLILLGSYAFFWHSRDWNTASRLMLTYALVDRGTVAITGLDQQTNDKAKFQRPVLFRQAAGLLVAGDVPYAVGQVGLSTAEPSAQRSSISVLGRRLLGHSGHIRTRDGRYWRRFSSCGHENWAVDQDGPRSSGWPTAWRRRPTFTPRSPTDTRPRRLLCLLRFSCSGDGNARATLCGYCSRVFWRRTQR